MALIGPTKPAAGVMATKPTTIAVAAPTAVVFCKRTMSRSDHTTKVPAGASIVDVKASAASTSRSCPQHSWVPLCRVRRSAQSLVTSTVRCPWAVGRTVLSGVQGFLMRRQNTLRSRDAASSCSTRERFSSRQECMEFVEYRQNCLHMADLTPRTVRPDDPT